MFKTTLFQALRSSNVVLLNGEMANYELYESARLTIDEGLETHYLPDQPITIGDDGYATVMEGYEPPDPEDGYPGEPGTPVGLFFEVTRPLTEADLKP